LEVKAVCSESRTHGLTGAEFPQGDLATLHKAVGDYDKLPPLEKQQVDLEQKSIETEIMQKELEQEKIKQELEALKNQKSVVEQKQKQTISPIEKITQDLSERAEIITALRKAKQEALAKGKSEEEKISIERMYEDKILEVQDE